VGEKGRNLLGCFDRWGRKLMGLTYWADPVEELIVFIFKQLIPEQRELMIILIRGVWFLPSYFEIKLPLLL